MVVVGKAFAPSVHSGLGMGGGLAVWRLNSGLAVVQSQLHCTVSQIWHSPLHQKGGSGYPVV